MNPLVHTWISILKANLFLNKIPYDHLLQLLIIKRKQQLKLIILINKEVLCPYFLLIIFIINRYLFLLNFNLNPLFLLIVSILIHFKLILLHHLTFFLLLFILFFKPITRVFSYFIVFNYQKSYHF